MELLSAAGKRLASSFFDWRNPEYGNLLNWVLENLIRTYVKDEFKEMGSIRGFELFGNDFKMPNDCVTKDCRLPYHIPNFFPLTMIYVKKLQLWDDLLDVPAVGLSTDLRNYVYGQHHSRLGGVDKLQNMVSAWVRIPHASEFEHAKSSISKNTIPYIQAKQTWEVVKRKKEEATKSKVAEKLHQMLEIMTDGFNDYKREHSPELPILRNGEIESQKYVFDEVKSSDLEIDSIICDQQIKWVEEGIPPIINLINEKIRQMNSVK
tara:strand:+ start:1926 stop:2717 length:792 start_codon:yes stop_codon:yes gene_type:complete